MKFSILVPVYNVEQYLEQCVESLLNQTFKGKYEIILVDDGSTDSSGKLCDEYAKKCPDKIKVVHKKNEGLVSARQAGIDAATGEYSLFVDSDDFVEPNLLESVILSKTRNPDTDIFIFNLNKFDNKNKIARKFMINTEEAVFENENKKSIYEALITGSFVTSLCLKAVRTDILKNDPTDYSLYYKKNMAEDWFRSIHLLTVASKIVYINKHLYNYRTNQQSISHSFRPKTIEEKNILYVYDRFIEYIPKWNIEQNESLLKLNARWLNEAMYTFTNYYENVSVSDRKAVLDFDWSTIIPVDAQTDSNNPYENKVYRKLYAYLMKKNFCRISFFFAIKKIKKFLRKLLKRGI